MTKRTPKTPRQRAEEALGIEERRVEKLTGQRDETKGRLQFLEDDLAAATKRRDHLSQSPDLPQAPEPVRRTRAPRQQPAVEPTPDAP